MQKLIQFLSEPLVGTALGFIGVALAVYFYFKAKQVSRLALQTEEISVIGSSTSVFDEHLEIRFSGEIVKRVTVSRATIWNCGNTTIEGSKITKSDPIRSEVVDGGKILKVEILKISREVIDVDFSHGASDAVVSFDFLDKNDGFVIEITHSGRRGDLNWMGTVRGMPDGFSTFNSGDPIERLARRIPRKLVRFVASRVPIIAGILGVLMAVAGLFNAQLEAAWPSLNWPLPANPGPRWSWVGVGLLYALLPVMMLWMRRRRFPASLDVRAKSTERVEASPPLSADGESRALEA